VKCLLDTHLLVWATNKPDKLSNEAAVVIDAPENELYFSAVSIWEVAIKQSLKRSDFTVEAAVLRRGLLEHGYKELPLTSSHSLAVITLPPIHQDPFDRILIAQAISENITLLTSDRRIAQYPGPIRRV